MIGLLFTLLAGGAVIGLGFVLRNQRLQGWRNAAAASGLHVQEVSGWTHRLKARTGPVEVTIETCGNKGQSTRIIAWFPGPPDFREVGIRREPLIKWGKEIEVGERSFDGTFFVEGPTRLVLALLGAETRRLLIDVNEEGTLELSGGSLSVSNMSDEKVQYVLPRLLELGRRLAQPLDVLRRLTGNAHCDPQPEVRLRNLLVLARELPGQPWTLEALRTSCADASPEIRLRAAQELGAEGHGVLRELVEGMEDDAVSARAVAHLGKDLEPERTQSVLFAALRRRRLLTARACLEALGGSGDPAAVEALAKVVSLERGELAAAAARALGATGSPAAEAALLAALQRDEADLRAAAAAALGRVGSVEAVLPLKEAAERAWLDLEVRRAARQAIAEIQARLQGATPGQLSLAGAGDAGQLSLAQDDAGQLSLAPHEPTPSRPSHQGRETAGGRRG